MYSRDHEVKSRGGHIEEKGQMRRDRQRQDKDPERQNGVRRKVGVGEDRNSK